jgi:hypothetical protein
MLAIERFFSNSSGVQRLVAFFLIVSVVTILIALLVGGPLTGVIVGILVLAILWITRPLLRPAAPSSNTTVRVKSLVVISTVALAVAGATPQAKPLVAGLLKHLGITHQPAEQPLPLNLPLSALILAFVLIGIFNVNWLAKDTSAMKKLSTPVDADFPEQPYRERLLNFTRILASRLNTLDQETKWDDSFFTPLEAEVEVVSGRQSRKSVVDLMTALRTDLHSRILLVLGDPGAGKSIALRQRRSSS